MAMAPPTASTKPTTGHRQRTPAPTGVTEDQQADQGGQITVLVVNMTAVTVVALPFCSAMAKTTAPAVPLTAIAQTPADD